MNIPESSPGSGTYENLNCERGHWRLWGRLSIQKMILEQVVNNMERMKLKPYIILYSKINSRWIKVLSIKFKSIKHLEGNVGECLYHCRVRKNFFNKTQCEWWKKQSVYSNMTLSWSELKSHTRRCVKVFLPITLKD